MGERRGFVVPLAAATPLKGSEMFKASPTVLVAVAALTALVIYAAKQRDAGGVGGVQRVRQEINREKTPRGVRGVFVFGAAFSEMTRSR